MSFVLCAHSRASLCLLQLLLALPLVQRLSGSALWPSAGYGFCDGGDTNNAEVDAHARGGLGIAQDFGMAGPAAGPPAHMYGAVAPQDSMCYRSAIECYRTN